MAPIATRDWTTDDPHNSSYWIWARRARVASTLLRPDQKWICDIGCGMQHLKWFLPGGSVYLPADIHPWTQDTEVCDLDAGRLPVRSLLVCDVAVMLGVIAYLEHPETVLHEIAGYAENLLVSYRTPQLTPERKPYWRNAYSETELVELLASAGFAVTDAYQYNGQVILRAVNTIYTDDHRARRASARQRWHEKPAYVSARRGLLKRMYFYLRTRNALRAMKT